MDRFFVNQRDVPESMLGQLPWGEPWKRWTAAMLERAQEGGHVSDSPAIAAAVAAELIRR